MSLGNRFKEFRKSIGMTQSELVKKYDYGREIISLIESDKTQPRLQFLYHLANDHNLNIHWLITGEGSMFGNEVPNLRELSERAARRDQLRDQAIQELQAENLELQRKLIQCQERLIAKPFVTP